MTYCLTVYILRNMHSYVMPPERLRYRKNMCAAGADFDIDSHIFCLFVQQNKKEVRITVRCSRKGPARFQLLRLPLVGNNY